MKFFSKKILISGLIIVVIVISSAVYFNSFFLAHQNSNNPKNPINPNNPTNSSTPTIITPTETLVNKTTNPFTSPETQLGGGNQFADFSFGATVTSTSLTNMHFIGTVSNYTESTTSGSVPTVNNFIRLSFYTNITSCDVTGLSTNQVSHYLNESQSITTGDINGGLKDEYIVAYGIGCGSQYDSELTVLSWNTTSNSFYQWGPNISLGLYYPSVIALYAKAPQPIMQIVVAGFLTPNATAITLKLIDYAPTGTTIPVKDASHLKIESYQLNNPNLAVKAHSLILERGDVFGNGSQEFLMYGNTLNTQSFALLYHYNATTDKMVELHLWIDADLGRPIFARFLDTPAEQIVIPKKDPPRSIGQYNCPGNPLPNLNYTDESGFIYLFNTTSYTVSKVAYLPITGIVGQANVDGTGQTSIILLNVNNPAFNSSSPTYCQSTYGTGYGTFTTHVYTYDSSNGYNLSYDPVTSTYNSYPEDTNTKFNVNNIVYGNGNLKNDLGYVYPDEKIITKDINYDANPDIVFPSVGFSANYQYGMLFASQPASPYYTFTNVYSNSNGYSEEPNYPLNTWVSKLQSGTARTSSNSTFGNFFGDAVTLKFKNQVWDDIDNPTILAVLAAPPTVYNISQAYSKSYTSYGITTSQSTSTGNQWGFSIGASVIVGASASVTVPVFGETIAKFTTKFSASFDYQSVHSTKSTHTITFSQQWLTGYTDDGVVFASILYRNWNYTLFDTINPTLNGKTWTYRVPLAITVQKFDLQAFNQLFPQYGLLKTFNHLIGYPSTYPNMSEIPSIATQSPILFKPPSSNIVEVGEGQGATIEEADVSQSVSQGSSVQYKAGFTSTTEAQVGGAIVGFQLRSSYSWGSSYQFTEGSATKYISHVGNILNLNQWNNYHYSFEIFAYVLARTDINLAYQVINYAVGTLGPSLLNTTINSPMQNYDETMMLNGG